MSISYSFICKNLIETKNFHNHGSIHKNRIFLIRARFPNGINRYKSGRIEDLNFEILLKTIRLIEN